MIGSVGIRPRPWPCRNVPCNGLDDALAPPFAHCDAFVSLDKKPPPRLAVVALLGTLEAAGVLLSRMTDGLRCVPKCGRFRHGSHPGPHHPHPHAKRGGGGETGLPSARWWVV